MIIVSPQSQLDLDFEFWLVWGLGGLELRLGLDNSMLKLSVPTLIWSWFRPEQWQCNVLYSPFTIVTFCVFAKYVHQHFISLPPNFLGSVVSWGRSQISFTNGSEAFRFLFFWNWNGCHAILFHVSFALFPHILFILWHSFKLNY